jgi:NTP pyrophosphatase (non-canonical NTP hydrolase)
MMTHSWTFQDMVGGLAKSGEAIQASLTPLKCHLWHMASCIPGEGGELFDAIKKFVIYEKPLDKANVIEELGDLEFYMEGLRAALGITRQQTLEANMVKLGKRYEAGRFSNQAAQTRADKAEGQA